jgi:hypothetical protein
MRKYFMVILIPSTIFSLWTMFQVYNGRGILNSRSFHKKFYLIVKQPEAFLKDMVKKNDERNNATRGKEELPKGSVSQSNKDKTVSDAVPTRRIDKVVTSESVPTQTKAVTPTHTRNKVTNDSSVEESTHRENTTSGVEKKEITSEIVTNCSKDGENLGKLLF